VHFERLWLSLLAVEKRAPARDIWRLMEAESGRYLRSELVQSIAAGILLNWGFRLLGHPYPVLVAFLGALAWMIPWLGGIFTILAAVALALPAGVSAGAIDWPMAISCGCFTLVVLTLLEFYVEPRLFDRSRYNSLLIVLLAIGLTDLFSVLGLLLAPPLAAALQILGERLIAQRTAKAQPQVLRAELPLRERLVHLRQILEENNEQRPQLLSLVSRLEGLVQQAERIPATGDENPTPADA
jgi:predicted PurR-regulated permease PerM